MDSATSIELEMRYGGQNVGAFFGSQKPVGPWSYEFVARVGFNDEDYKDGAKTKRDFWGFQTVIGYNHTWYFKPSINGHFKYDFTDLNGTTFDIDTKPSYAIAVAYKFVENFLIYAQYSNNQRNSLEGSAQTGNAFQITADLSF